LQGRLEEIAAFAHWLKGTGGTVGFDEFTAPAANLERLAKEGGGELEIQEAIVHLRGLSERLVIPNAKSTDASILTGGLTREPSTECELPPPQPFPVTEKPVMSRLGSSPRFRKVILQFIEKLKEELIRAQAAWEREDLEELALIAHWLKDAGGTVGFDDFAEPAARLENFAKRAQLDEAGEMLRQVKCLLEAIVRQAVTYGRTAA
jgi:HPt (histidine-containing phosphotransfer) domain-containing protein